jgi:hypothetical protein
MYDLGIEPVFWNRKPAAINYPMALNLDSVNAKLSWAEEHAKTFRSEARPWMESGPYRAIQQSNSDATHYSLVAKLVGAEPPLQKWSLLIGDALHNLRCSLDHLVHAIAVHESGNNSPPNDELLAFPICNDCPAFTKVERRRLAGISQNVRTTIETVQPYHRGHPKVPPPLTILRDLDNTDKHKLLRVAYATPIQGDIGFSGPEHPLVKRVEIAANYGEVKDGSELVSHTFDAPAPDMKYDRINIDLSVAIWHGKRSVSDPDWASRSDASALLTLIFGEVRYVIDTVSAAVA